MFEYLNNMKNNISFKSQIHIITSPKFKKIITDKSIYFCNYGKYKNIIKSNNFNTAGIKTCTGGILVNSDKTNAVGFHLWDALTLDDLMLNLKNIKNTIQSPINGVLIGSKKIINAKNSIPNFDKIYNDLLTICPNLSYFKTFTKEYGSADFKYISSKDTLYILLKDIVKKQGFDQVKEISNLSKLRTFFKEIYISPSDTLFINGKKISMEDAPEFFIKNKL